MAGVLCLVLHWSQRRVSWCIWRSVMLIISIVWQRCAKLCALFIHNCELDRNFGRFYLFLRDRISNFDTKDLCIHRNKCWYYIFNFALTCYLLWIIHINAQVNATLFRRHFPRMPKVPSKGTGQVRQIIQIMKGHTTSISTIWPWNLTQNSPAWWTLYFTMAFWKIYLRTQSIKRWLWIYSTGSISITKPPIKIICRHLSSMEFRVQYLMSSIDWLAWQATITTAVLMRLQRGIWSLALWYAAIFVCWFFLLFESWLICLIGLDLESDRI